MPGIQISREERGYGKEMKFADWRGCSRFSYKKKNIEEYAAHIVYSYEQRKTEEHT